MVIFHRWKFFEVSLYKSKRTEYLRFILCYNEVMNDFLRKVEDYHNHLSDKSFIWFPFIFLKPRPNEPIREPRKLMMAICFGSYGTGVLMLKHYFFNTLSLETYTITLLKLTVSFYLWFSLVTCTFWNRRATRISKDS